MLNILSKHKIGGILCGFLMCGYVSLGQLQTVQLYSEKDTYIVATQSGSSYTGDGNNYGTSSTLAIKKTTNGPPITVRTVYRSLVYFNLDTIPFGSVITSARIELKKSYPSPYSAVSYYAMKITKDWNENSVTWSDISTSTYSADRVSNVTPIDSSKVQFNVLDHVKTLICREKNFGWMVTISSEGNDTPAQKGLNFYTRESAYDPILRIEYYTPIQVTCLVNGASTTSSTDGSLDISVTGGYGSGYIYSWANSSGTTISSSQDISSVSAGYYRCTISDSYGGIYKAYFIVPCESEDIVVTIRPDSLFSEDALILKSYETANFENYGRFFAGFGTAPGPNWSEIKALLKFPIELNGLDDGYSVTEADIILTGFSHSNSGGSNASTARRIIGDWCEKCLTWQKSPSTISQNSITIPSLTGSQSDTIDVSGLLDRGVMEPTLNLGFEIKINAALTSPSSCYLSFYGSESMSTIHHPKRPAIKLRIIPSPIIGVAKRQLDASYYTFRDEIVRFQFIEEYSNIDGELDFEIYRVGDSGDSPVLTSSMVSPISSPLGDHIRVIDVSSLSTGFYILEIKNDKQESLFLRFNI